MISHNGALDGTSSRIALLPSQKVGIVVLTNLHGTSITNALIYHIIDAYLGTASDENWNAKLLATAKEEQTQAKAKEFEIDKNRLKDTKPSFALARYQGIYSHEIYGDILITSTQEGLQYHFHSFKGELVHWQLETFSFFPPEEAPYATQALLTFVINEQQEIDRVLVSGIMEGAFYKK